MSERWLAIPGYEGYYEASSIGQIRSIAKVAINGQPFPSTVLKQRLTARYLYTMLSKDGVKTNHRVHRLICKTFHPDTWFEGAIVNHLDRSPLNNSADNLEWCTQSHNTKHSFDNSDRRVWNKGTNGLGRSKPVIKLSLVGHPLKEYASSRETGTDGYNPRHVNECCNGKRKTHQSHKWIFKN